MIFLLIQDGIVDTSATPAGLMFNVLDLNRGFKVAVGCDRGGNKEVVGIVADAEAIDGCGDWMVSSEADGELKRIGGWGFVESFVRVRLSTQYRQGQFDDLANLPKPVIVRRVPTYA